LHVISKRYTQRIERHNLNLRQHLARLGRKSLSFSKSVELHDNEPPRESWRLNFLRKR
ncbi:IS1 family transposase, partial [Escherichia coli]|uniref:IS1 family transposase n=1 Tax=Escherichia coli TaxID=562 RepID=UPI0020BEDFDB